MYHDIYKAHVKTNKLVLRLLDLRHLLLQRHGAIGAMSLQGALGEGACWSFVHHRFESERPNIEPQMAGIGEITNICMM
jgi:hypothetical protein